MILHSSSKNKERPLTPWKWCALLSLCQTYTTLVLILCYVKVPVAAMTPSATLPPVNQTNALRAFIPHIFLGIISDKPQESSDLPSIKQGIYFHRRVPRSTTTIRRIELHGPRLPNKKTLFVEIVVLIDSSFNYHYGKYGAYQRVSQLLGVSNRVLGDVGLRLVPAEMQVWETGDQFRISSRMKNNIDNLQSYRHKLLQQYPNLPNDHTILVTRKSMKGRKTCGSPLQGMCRQRESVSILQDDGETPSVAGVSLAHEIGHSLGMKDDDGYSDKSCHCHTGTCVMSQHFRNVSMPSIDWSSCSREFFESVRDTLGLDCLKNVPTMKHPTTTCGDGVVDDGEQCDCGPEEFCDNPCCVASTCIFAVNASCASGSCCNIETCKPKPPGTVCRAILTECDLPEFCSGHSEYCPTDVTQVDGVLCRQGQGHCYKGECGSHEGRCIQLWGTESSEASHECYLKYNVKGNHAGNCGFQSEVYRRCQTEDSLCGTLHCLPSMALSFSLSDHRNATRRAGANQCTFISASKNYPDNHWLAPNGATCGVGKMCVNQRCQEVPSVIGDCRGGCSGHGVCNSRGHCHCDAGYAPPVCSVVGLGGSIDSNVMSSHPDVRGKITAMWVLLILLASLMAVTVCSWGYFKGWYKRKGRDTVQRVFPCCVTCLDTCCCPMMTKTARWVLTVRSSQKIKSSKNVEAEEGANQQMLCSVNVDIKGTSETNSWGVANEKLVTEVVTITPKNSPDLRRKVRLPSDSPVLCHKSQENLQRPQYLQSHSRDSGCVSDTDDEGSSKRSSLHLSMSSLLGTLKKIGNKNDRTLEKESNPSRFGSQKSMPLSRLVVDPLARQVTPPPEQVKPSYHRSFSTDIPSMNSHLTSIPSPSDLKPTRSEENLSIRSEPININLTKSKHSSPSRQKSASPKEHVHANVDRNTVTNGGCKVPLRPPLKKTLRSSQKRQSSKENSAYGKEGNTSQKEQTSSGVAEGKNCHHEQVRSSEFSWESKYKR